MFWLIPPLDIKVPAYLLIEKSWAHSIIGFLILACALFYILKLALMLRPEVRNSPVDFSILGFLFICALSLIYSVNRNISIRSLLALFSYVVFFFLVIHAVDRADVVKFCALLVGLATALSLYGLYEYIFLYRFIGEHIDISFVDVIARKMISLRRVSSVFGWPNRLAGFLGMTIPVSIGLFFHEKRPKFRILLIVSAIVMLVCMLFTFSIGGWIALMGALIFAGILSFRLMGRKLREVISRRKALVSVIALLLIIAMVSVGGVIVKKRATPITLGAIKCRAAYLRGALGIIRDNFILGTGLGTFKLIYPQYMPPMRGYGTKHVHNSYLEIWSEVGLVGVILFLIFIGQLISVGLRSFSNMGNQGHRFVMVGLISGIIAFLLHNILEFTYYCPEVSLYWWLLAGLLLAYTKEEGGFFRFNYIGNIARRISVLVLTAILLFWALLTLKNNFVGDIHFSRAIRFVRAGELQKGIREYKKALCFTSKDSRYHFGLGDAYYSLSIRRGGKKGLLHKAKREYQEAIRLNPNLAEAHNRLANIYEMTNRRLKAIEEYKRAIKLNTAFARAHYNLGIVYSKAGKPNEAKQEFEKATKIDPDFAPARQALRYFRDGS